MNSNERKSIALGMSYGKAYQRLRKRILFVLVCKLNMNICYRCSKIIDNINDLSIEHKEPWELSDSPVDNFFDINNIAFSHLPCNIRAAVKPNKKYNNTKDRHRVYQATAKGIARKKRWVEKRTAARIAQRKERKNPTLEAAGLSPATSATT